MLSLLKKIFHGTYEDIPREIWLLSFTMFINRSGTMVLFFTPLYIRDLFSLTIQETTQWMSCYGLGSLVGISLGGLLADRMTIWRLQFWTLFLGGTLFFFLGLIRTSLMFGFFLFILAVVNEAFRPANATALVAFAPDKIRARCFALHRSALNLGMTLGPFIGGILAQYSYMYLFIVDGLTCIVAAFLIFFFLSKKEMKRIPPSLEALKQKPWHDTTFLKFLFLLSFLSWIFSQLMHTWPLFLQKEQHLSEDQIGGLLACNAFLIALFGMGIVHYFEKFNVFKVIAWGGLFLGGGFAILPFGTGFLFLFFSLCIWTLGEAMIFPLASSFIGECAPQHLRGRYMGLFSLNMALAHFLGALGGGWLYQHYGSVALWGSCFLFAGISFMGLYRLKVRSV